MRGWLRAAGSHVTSIEGDPPKSRVVVIAWDSIEKIHKSFESVGCTGYCGMPSMVNARNFAYFSPIGRIA
jgi:uncharacterized protein (DUF1330 family)